MITLDNFYYLYLIFPFFHTIFIQQVRQKYRKAQREREDRQADIYITQT